MLNNHHQENKERRLAQDDQLRQLFLSLKTLALAILIMGILLLIVLKFSPIDPVVQLVILMFFGITSGGFIIARARSILIYYGHSKEKSSEKETNRQ